MPGAAVRLRSRVIATLFAMPLALTLGLGSPILAEDPQALSDKQVIEHAKAAWDNGDRTRALDLLDHGIQDHPHALTLHKLRGDILATSRGPREAVAAYETVLAKTPTALDVRWAKWSVLTRSGQGKESIDELRRIAEVDVQNPLIHLRLAQELRKLDRLEESVASYQKAVELVPKMLGWRLALARARFDVLDYEGADSDVEYVLHNMPPGSPLELPANNLRSVIHGSSQDHGRRFDPLLTPEGVTAAQLKEWALIRADAWRLFVDGRFQEAEPIYRKLLTLNPKDPPTVRQLGLTLMQLGRCKDALIVFQDLSNLDLGDDGFHDTVFRKGQCLVELEQWEDAFVHFQTLYDAAVEFEESTKGTELPPDTRVLDKAKLAGWLEKVRPHVPEFEKLRRAEAENRKRSGDPSHATGPSDEERYAIVLERLKPQKPLDTGAALMGRDADFSLFRFVIPANKIVRDDSPTGAHDFIPLNPGDSFPPTQLEIYLVFGLVSDSYDAVPLTARCFLETSEVTGEPRAIVQDQVMMSMNDQSGYFTLSRPAAGWTSGLYRCGLFAGERTSAYTRVDEVYFRIIEPPQAS